ncbi:two-component system sensor histidine kinase NtrB [Maricaulis sp. CAU 1757]
MPTLGAAEWAAVPILVFDASGVLRQANVQAEEWLNASASQLRRAGLGAHSARGKDVDRLVRRALDRRSDVAALACTPAGEAPFDMHARWDEAGGRVCVTVIPPSGPGGLASDDAALGFGRMLAHELKNPLASVRGAAQLIGRSGDADSHRELAELIIQDVDRITRLANQWSRVGDIRCQALRPTSLNAVAVEALDAMGRAGLPTPLHLGQAFDPSLPDTDADPDLLLQAVLNLVRNACDAVAGRSQGRVEIATRYEGGRRSREGPQPLPLVIAVRDNGAGVPAELGERIFTPFVTTKPAGEGLGLAFAARVATLHGGAIDYASGPDGSEFRLRLPLASGGRT